MNKFIVFNAKKYEKIYFWRCVVILIPFIPLIFLFAFMKFSGINILEVSHQEQIINLCLGFSIMTMLVIILFMLIFTRRRLSAHKANTFIDIHNGKLIISLYNQTIFKKFKRVYYKSVYVVNLYELENINIDESNLHIKGKIKYIHDKSDRLHYEFIDKNLEFDYWWYNYNCTESLEEVLIPNLFSSSSRLVNFIMKISKLEKARAERRKKYHDELIAIAKKVK